MEIDEQENFVPFPRRATQEELLQAVIEGDDYSETKAKRKAVGNALAQLIGYFNRDVKRNRELASLASAREYVSRYPKYGLRVEAEDLDRDKDSPDNTVVYRKNGNIYAVDGFYTAPGFGGKNKKTKQRILKSRDTMQGYFGTGDYATILANRGKDKKITVDNSLFTPYQRYQGLVKGKITEDNHWIVSDKQPSVCNAFKKLISQNMESIRAGSSKCIGPTLQIVSRLWNGILAQAARQLDPQGTRIQEYRTENPASSAQLTDIDIAKHIFNIKKRGKKLDAVAFQIIQSQVNNIRQILIDNGFQ
ncbi:MAG: hypothetical protein EZS28_020524 [Streblomastix strix]|uniref:Uncharacterized protein n=1 Tax=Streblomastix strix TaxID=222440 RepID=A0A5J4VMW1_9EUKA|nr:MAG: hypothetical protein EZS28_020524 [Streblomastix strix]